MSDVSLAEALDDTTIEDAEPIIAQMTLPELDAVEAAEKAGQDRKGILEAVEKRRAELSDDSSDAPASEPEVEPTEEERAAAERAKVEVAASAPREDVEVEEEEPEVLEAPVEEIKPIIRTGDWVVLGAGRGVPRRLVNLDAVVERANVRHSEGGDELSPNGYEYQDDSDVFLVRVRNTGETLEVTRGAVLTHGTQQSELGFRS